MGCSSMEGSMDSSYGPLSKSDEKLRAEKNNTGDPPAAGLNGLAVLSMPVFEHTCACARWAHMHRFVSVCRDWTKIQTRN